jgi:hypothetical protein
MYDPKRAQAAVQKAAKATGNPEPKQEAPESGLTEADVAWLSKLKEQAKARGEFIEPEIFATNKTNNPSESEMHPAAKKVLIAIGAVLVAWWILQPGLPTGYVGRDGKYDVYCGYKYDGLGGSDYDCEREPATYLNRK